MRVKLYLAWYDLWVGVYVAWAKRTIYVCPLPTVVIEVAWGPRPPDKSPDESPDKLPDIPA